MENKRLYLDDILKILPHRPPFLFVDEAEIGDEKVIGFKKLHADDGCFKGHFPDYPVLPGVLTIECCAQVSALLAYYAINGAFSSGYDGLRLIKVEEANFRREIRPNDLLQIEASLSQIRVGQRYSTYRAVAKVTVNGDVAADVKLMGMAGPK